MQYVLTGQFDATKAESSFDQTRARDLLYRQMWLDAHVRLILHLEGRYHLTKRDECLFKVTDLIEAAVSTSRRNVINNIWPRLIEAIDDESITDPFVLNLRANWHEVFLHHDEGRITLVSSTD